jgi:molybdenum cofactor cytidylyltransferase
VYRIRKNISSSQGGGKIREKTTGLILAAGESKRYGSNKLLSLYEGRYLLDYVVNLVRENFENRLIVLGKYFDDIVSKINLEDFKVLYNERYNQGLSSSVKKGFMEVKTEWAMVFLGDMPKVKKDLIDILYNRVDNKYKAYYPVYNNIKGFPVLVNQVIYNEVHSIKGDMGLRYILEENPLSLKIEINDPSCIFDVDRMVLDE